MSLLTIVQDASRQLGLSVPSGVVTATEPEVLEQLRFANVEGYELARSHDWEILVTERTFTTVAAEEQTTAMPADFLRFVNSTFWNRTEQERLIGPMTPQEWQLLKAETSVAADNYFRYFGGKFYAYPAPPAGQTWAFEYVSLNWAASNTGTPKASFTADTDVARISEQLIALGVVWRWKKSKGLPFEADLAEYRAERIKEEGNDAPRRVVSLTKPRMPFARPPRVPEGSWNL